MKVCTFLTTLIPPLVDLPPKKNKWIFSCISSRFSVLPFCLPPLYYFLSYFFFFIKFALLMTVPQSAHLCDATEHRQLCTDLMSLFRSCNSTYFSLFFCLSAVLHCIFFRLFFSNFALSMTALMLMRTVLQSAHLSNATEYLQPCTILMSFFWSCKRTSTILFLSFFFYICVGIFFFYFFMISLQCWWIENLHRTTSLFEAHRLAFHSASLL